MTEERPTVERVASSTPEPLKPERTSNFSLYLSIAVLMAVGAMFIQSGQLQERTKEFLGSSIASASRMPSTLISRDGLYISEVLTDDRVEQEEIDRAFDAFDGVQGKLELSVLSLWRHYQYLTIFKLRSNYYHLYFSNSLPEWRTNEETKRRDFAISEAVFWVDIRNERTYEGSKPWPGGHRADFSNRGVILTYVIPDKSGWIRWIATKDFRINSYGEKHPRTDRAALAEFFGGKYPFGKKTFYTSVVP